MSHIKTYTDLLPEFIIGAEGEEDGQQSGNESGGNESGSGDEDAGNASDGSQGSHDDADDPKVQGLKSALEKERRTAKAQADELKELRKLKKEKEAKELSEKDEITQATTLAEQATARAERLASGFLRTHLNSAITKAAEKAGFIDADDALSGVDIEKLTYEQDEEDPSQVNIDLKSIEREVKALAVKKPHFVKSGTTDGERSGSQFGGGRGKGSQTSDEKLLERYPSLRGSN